VSTPSTRPPAREAGPELLCLQKWEDTAGWLIEHTAKWPKSARFSFVQKVDNQTQGGLRARRCGSNVDAFAAATPASVPEPTGGLTERNCPSHLG
jgi:hypothetical protein